jgi:hypothetical protein
VPKSIRHQTVQPQLVILEDRTTPAAAFVLSNNTLIPIETEFPTLPRPAILVRGLGDGENLVGIDFRPQNNQLYGLAADGAGGVRLYAISHRTGLATPLTAAPVQFSDADGKAVAVTGKSFGIDFNPTVDRLRVVTDTGLNFRMDPNTGAIIDGDPDMPGVQPDGNLNGGAAAGAATAYTNSFANAAATTQYTLDVASSKLFIQNPPNAGTLTNGLTITFGGKPLEISAAGGFDIPFGITVDQPNEPAAGTALAVLTVEGRTGLYGINLADGKSARVGLIGNGTIAAQGFAIYPASNAVPAIGFEGTNLVRFSSANPGNTFTVEVIGVATNEVLVGLDFRPATGQLYGLGVDAAANTGTLYRLDPQTGAATVVGTAGSVAFVDAAGKAIDLPDAQEGYGFDFNPTVDRIRVVTGSGLNFRLHPDTGNPIDGDPDTPGIQPDGAIGGGTTGVTGTAYTNSFAGAKVTTQYTLDAATNKLFIQDPPNSGTQTAAVTITVDGKPLEFTAVNGFDIPPSVAVSVANAPAAKGTAFAALTVDGQSGLYAIDLVTGAATPLGTIGDATTPLVALAVGDGLPLDRRVDLFAVGSGAGLPATVKVYNPDGAVRFTLIPYEETFTGGVLVATGDVNGDGVDDIITGTGVGGGPRVRIFDGVTAQLIREFFPYEDTFRGGVIVAAGDVNGDGIADIITGTGVGGGPRVQIFDGATGQPLANYFAYEETFRGGVLVAAADTTGDGKAEVITGTGVGGGPRVQVFEGLPRVGSPVPVVLANFFAYEDAFRGGVLVAGGDVNRSGRADIITGTGPGGGPRVLVFDAKTNDLLANFFAFEPTFTGGVRVASIDRDGDGAFDIITGTGPGIANRVLIYAAGGLIVSDLRPFEMPFTGGVFVG